MSRLPTPSPCPETGQLRGHTRCCPGHFGNRGTDNLPSSGGRATSEEIRVSRPHLEVEKEEPPPALKPDLLTLVWKAMARAVVPEVAESVGEQTALRLGEEVEILPL